jgi:hypothetical protein
LEQKAKVGERKKIEEGRDQKIIANRDEIWWSSICIRRYKWWANYQ